MTVEGLNYVIARNVSDEAIQRKNVCKDNLMHWTATAINRLAVTVGRVEILTCGRTKLARFGCKKREIKSPNAI